MDNVIVSSKTAVLLKEPAMQSTLKYLLRLAAGCALASAMLTTGCGVSIATPPGFARLDSNDDFDWRATSAEGVVLGVRREPNKPAGNLEFWASAVRYELERQGYSKVDVAAVRSKDGVDGQMLRYRTSRNGRPHVLWTAVYVTDSRVVVVEAGGDEAHFARVEKAVDKAMQSVEAG